MASVLGKHCLYPSTERCHYRFHIGVEPGSPQLQISRQPGEEWIWYRSDIRDGLTHYFIYLPICLTQSCLFIFIYMF